jgi:DNA-binding response OmpR family regulator
LLQRAGAKAVCLSGIAQALQAGGQLTFDAAVIDGALLHPPEEAWLSKLRFRLDCPLLVLADQGDEVDEIIALEQGADDYLVRPVSSRRLSARLTALVRQPLSARHAQDAAACEGPLQAGGWSFDPVRRVLSKGARSAALTELLATLLTVLLENDGKIVSRQHLLQRVRGLGSHTKSEGIATYMHRLRRSLREQGVHDFVIDCLSGRGYLLRLTERTRAEVDHAA